MIHRNARRGVGRRFGRGDVVRNELQNLVAILPRQDVRVENRRARCRTLAFADKAELAVGAVEIQPLGEVRRQFGEVIFAALRGEPAIFVGGKTQFLQNVKRERYALHHGRIRQQDNVLHLVWIGIDNRHRLRIPDFWQTVGGRSQRLANAHFWHVLRPQDVPGPSRGLGHERIGLLPGLPVEERQPRDGVADIRLLRRGQLREVEAVLHRIVLVETERTGGARPNLPLAVAVGDAGLALDTIPEIFFQPRIFEDVERMRTRQRPPRRAVRPKRLPDVVGQHDLVHLQTGTPAGRILDKGRWRRRAVFIEIGAERPRHVATRTGQDERMLFVRIVAGLGRIVLAVDRRRLVRHNHARTARRRAGFDKGHVDRPALLAMHALEKGTQIELVVLDDRIEVDAHAEGIITGEIRLFAGKDRIPRRRDFLRRQRARPKGNFRHFAPFGDASARVRWRKGRIRADDVFFEELGQTRRERIVDAICHRFAIQVKRCARRIEGQRDMRPFIHPFDRRHWRSKQHLAQRADDELPIRFNRDRQR